MVIGLFIITAIPTVTGVAQAYSAQKTNEERQKEALRMRKFYIDICCDADDPHGKRLNGGRIVFENERVWIGPPEAINPCSAGYVAEAFYIEYPDKERKPTELGLPSQVRDDPPLLNWIYVDRETMELKHGNKTASIMHHIGPWDWSEDETRVTLAGEERFVAVEEPKSHRWQLFFDVEDDLLQAYIPKGRKRSRVRLERTIIPGT